MTWRRRLIPAVFILLIGGAIAIWSSQNTAARVRVVEEQMTRLCLAIAAESDVSETFPAQPHIRREVLPRLKSICAPLAKPELALSVQVSPGDVSGYGGALGGATSAATHHAVVMVNDEPVLGLRLAWEEPPGRAYIIGYWLPQ